MAQPQGTDDRLIERARAGDRRAQQTLWQSHRRWVAAIILAHRPGSVEVEDLMQEAAVKFLSKIDTLRDIAAFRPWMRQIILNICRGAGRRHRPALRLGAGTEEEPGPTPVATTETAVTGLGRRDAAATVLQHAMTLPPEYREPLLLRCVRSMSYQQIGEILDLPVTTIETRLARARRMLRAEIGEDAVAEECAEDQDLSRGDSIMLDHEHNDLNEADLIISRMIDGTSTADEDTRFDCLASAEPTLWREAALRLRDTRQLTVEFETATAAATQVDLPRPIRRILPRQIGWPLAVAGWAAVLMIGISWFATALTTNRPSGPKINPAASLTPEGHFEAYLRAPYVVGDLTPEILGVQPMTDGRVAVEFIRRVEEIAFLDPNALPVDESGELIRSATGLRAMEPTVSLPQ